MKYLKHIKTLTCSPEEISYVKPFVNDNIHDIEEIVIDWHEYKANRIGFIDDWGLYTWGEEYTILYDEWTRMAHNPRYAEFIAFTFLG